MIKKPKTEHIVANDVFISYRRDGGATVARLLCEVLEKRGITVFFDTVSLGAGDFDVAIRNQLEAAKNVVFIASPNVFTRCEDENDWVRKELELSLDLNKNIVPVFVNGVTGFPANLPGKLPAIANKNACTLNHEHFDDNLRTLVSRLITPRHELIQAYLKTDSKYYEDDDSIEFLLGVCKQLAGKNGKQELQKMLSDRIRHYWEHGELDDESALEALLDSLPISYTKDLCKQINIDNTGGKIKLKKNLLKFLKRDETVSKFNTKEEENDHICALINAFSERYKSHEDRQTAIAWAEKLEAESDNKRSSYYVFKAIFFKIDIEDFFDQIKLPETTIKEIAEMLPIELSGRKNNLIQQIINYINYEDTQ